MAAAGQAALSLCRGGETEGRDDDFHTTVLFEDAGQGRTLLTMRSVFKTAEMRRQAMQYGALQGGYQTIDKLSEFVADARSGMSSSLDKLARVVEG